MYEWRCIKAVLNNRLVLAFIIFSGVCLYLLSTNEYLEDLKSENIMVKNNAIYRLGEDQEGDALPMLIELINREQPPKIRLSAIEALGKICKPGFIDIFKDTGLRLAAVDKLAGLLADKDKELRLAAVDALGKIKEPRAVKPLVDILNDKDSQPFVIRALGNIGDKGAVSALTELLDDPDEYVSYNAIQALKNIGEAE